MIGVKIVLWWLTVLAAWYLSDSTRTRPPEDDLLSASFQLKLLSEDGNSSTIIETGRISLFGQSIAEAAGDTCSAFLSDRKDFTSCVMSIANALRIKRLDILQWILQIAMNRLPTSATTRTRDHELLAILRHFDHWDTNAQLPDSPLSSGSSAISDGRRRVVCMLGEDIRPHLLLTFASFTTVRKVHYIFFLHRSRQESFNPHWGIPFLSSDTMATIAKKLPSGKEIKATHITMDNDDDISSFHQLLTDCSVVVLPSDEEVALYPAHIWTLLTTTLRTVSSLSSVPIVWISDTVHTTTTAVAARAAPAAATAGLAPCAPHCDHPFRHTFRWLLQDTWSIESTILSLARDGEGFPREQYVWPSHHDGSSDGSRHHPSQPPHSAQQQTLSSVYLGFMNLLSAATADTMIDGATAAAHRPPAATPSTKETTIVIITFADRIYAETAWGLHQQLREELHYPHVLLVPQLSVEIWQYVETYLETSSSTDEASSGSPSSASSASSASSWSIVQIVLTPHMAYGARLVPSSFSRYGITWQLSYVVVVLEQEWYFQTVQQAFVGVVPLLQDAVAVWTFSPVQRDVVRRIYTQQWQEQRHRRDTQPPDIVVDVVPIFAPCAPSMPCHVAFEPPPLPSSSTQSHSVGAYELIFFGHDVGGERSRFLAMLQPQLAVALPSLRFSPRMPSILKAHRHRHDTGEAKAASAASVDGKDDNEEEEDDESLLPLVGRARDVVMLSRSTIALNLRMHTLSVLEIHRLVYLLSMGKCIVSQRGRDPSLTSLSMLEGAVYFVDTVDDVVATLQFLLTPTDDTGTGKAEETGPLPLSTKTFDWIVQAHGRYQRLARCEQRSLAAYRAIHTMYNQTTMKTASVPTTSDADESIESPQLMYSTVALERAMQRLLLSRQRPPSQH